jgi:hypothetical protein
MFRLATYQPAEPQKVVNTIFDVLRAQTPREFKQIEMKMQG